MRPVASGAGVAADAYVLSAMDDPSQSDAGLGEYVTAVSQEEEAEPELQNWRPMRSPKTPSRLCVPGTKAAESPAR